MAKPKASKLIDTSTLIAGIATAYDNEVAARRARITALREWSKQTAGLHALSEKDEKHVRESLVAAYKAKGLKDKSAVVMASQDMRFIKAYTTDAKFRATADTVDSIAAAFPSTRAPGGDTPLKRVVRAIKKAKLENRIVALEWIAKHPENAIVLIENYLKEQSQLAAGLKSVTARSETPRAPRIVRVRRGAGQSQQVAA